MRLMLIPGLELLGKLPSSLSIAACIHADKGWLMEGFLSKTQVENSFPDVGGLNQEKWGWRAHGERPVCKG